MDENQPETKSSKWGSRLKDFLAARGKMLIVCVLVLVILVIFASSLKPKSTSETSSNLAKGETSFGSLEYSRELENRLEQVLSAIEGVGKVEVFVLVEASPKVEYLKEESSSTNKDGQTSSQTSVFEQRNGSETCPVVTVEFTPKVIGVLVVATGAKDIKLKTTLINAVSSVLSVKVSNVEVLEGKR